MPSIKKKPTVYEESDEEEITFEEYLKTLTIEDFLAYPKTRQYLEEQHYLEFDYLPTEAINRCYSRMKQNAVAYFPGVLELDYNAERGDSLAYLIFNNINMKADIEVFRECPALASGINKYDPSNHVENITEKQTTKSELSSKSDKKFDWATKTYK